MNPATRSKVATGLMLIVLGLGLYGMQYLGEAKRPVVLGLIGGLSIAGYFATRSYFLLVLGGITSGLAIGMFGEPRWLILYEFSEIGLGIGFLLIYLIRLIYEKRSHWWPLIPSLILFLLGFQAWRGFRQFVFSRRGWPILLAILGVLIVLGALGRGKKNKPASEA